MSKSENAEIRHILQAIRLDLVFKFRPILSSLLESIIHLENNLPEFDGDLSKAESLIFLNTIKAYYFDLLELLTSARVQLNERLSADVIILDDFFEIHSFPNRKLIHYVKGHFSLLMGYSSMLEMNFKELNEQFPEQFPEQVEIRKVSVRIHSLIQCINKLSLFTDELSDNLETIFNILQKQDN